MRLEDFSKIGVLFVCPPVMPIVSVRYLTLSRITIQYSDKLVRPRTIKGYKGWGEKMFFQIISFDFLLFQSNAHIYIYI